MDETCTEYEGLGGGESWDAPQCLDTTVTEEEAPPTSHGATTGGGTPEVDEARANLYAAQCDGTGGAPPTGDGAQGGPPAPAKEGPLPPTVEELEAQAVDKMDELDGLPADEQAEAVKNLSKEEFEDMVSNLPMGRREELDDFVIDNRVGEIPSGQEDAFRADAANCTSQEQLDKLTEGLQEGPAQRQKVGSVEGEERHRGGARGVALTGSPGTPRRGRDLPAPRAGGRRPSGRPSP
jgi:hypothetical protein